ncbi:MAG: CotH kinase family protein, partial [Pontiellaceae bacterium]|nr:CotH kinase family protein [Pontiellaceae bacterium]
VSVISNELHASFKLSAGGEYLALVNSDNEVIHQYSPEFPPQTTDVSYGLDGVSGGPTYFAVPTPGTTNGQGIAEAVQFSASSGTFTNAFSLTLSVNSTNASIRYTTNGLLPATNSTLYTAPTFIHLTADAAAFTSDLPLIILENFGAGEIPATTNPPPNLQLITALFIEPVNGTSRLTDTPVISSRAGIRRRGESTMRATDNKPNLALETWGETDDQSRSIKPFGLPAESDWVLHAPWNIDTAMMRNSFIYDVSREAGRYASRNRFIEVFLNYDGGSVSASDYCGLYVLLEKIKIGPDRVDIKKLSPAADTEPDISGGYLWKKDKMEAIDDPNNFVIADQQWPTNMTARPLQFVSPSGTELTETQKTWITNYLNAADATIPSGNYTERIDVESFADHHILNVFSQNADGLSASTFYFKDRNGRINMGPIWDFDRSMGCDNDTRPSNPEVWSFAADTQFFFRSAGILWFAKWAAGSPDFWMKWTDCWQAMRDGPLSDANIEARIEGYRTEISDAAERNYTRWTFTNCPNPEAWPGKVDTFKNHVLTRAHWIDNQLLDPPALNQAGGLVTNGFQVTLSNGTNRIYYAVNGADPRAPGGRATGTLYSASISITENTLIKARTCNRTNFSGAPQSWPWSPLREAMFVVTPAPLAITEIMYHPRTPTNDEEMAYSTSDFEFIEVQNTSGASCRLTGVQFLDGVNFDFTYGSNTTLDAGAYGAVVANLDAFKLRYPDWAERNILGVFTGKLNNDSERLKLGYAPTNMAPLLSFDYEADWYPCRPSTEHRARRIPLRLIPSGQSSSMKCSPIRTTILPATGLNCATPPQTASTSAAGF